MKHKLKPVPDKIPPIGNKFRPPSPKNVPAEDTPKRPESPISKATSIPKPPPPSKPSAVSERMKMFQQNNESKTSPAVSKLKPPPKPAANESPTSRRKIDKKANVSDLTSMFGGRASMTSPVSDRSSPSPEARPNLPPKPAGSTQYILIHSAYNSHLYGSYVVYLR